MAFGPSLSCVISIRSFGLKLAGQADSRLVLPNKGNVGISAILNGLNVRGATLKFLTKFAKGRVREELGRVKITSSFVRVGRNMSQVGLGLGSVSKARVGKDNPIVSTRSMRGLVRGLSGLKRNSILFLTKDVPSSVPSSVCRGVVTGLSNGNIVVIMSTAESLLLGILRCRPFLVGPGGRRLKRVFSIRLLAERSIMPCTGGLRRGKTEGILMSVTKRNTILMTRSKDICSAPTPGKRLGGNIKTKSSVMTKFVTN